MVPELIGSEPVVAGGVRRALVTFDIPAAELHEALEDPELRRRAIAAAATQIGPCGFDRWGERTYRLPDGTHCEEESLLTKLATEHRPVPAGTRVRFIVECQGGMR